MDAGEMRHKVWLQEATESRDSEGGVVRTWQTIAYVSASINPMSGRETEIALAMQALATHRITIRWQQLFGYQDLTKMRFISNSGLTFNIESTIEEDYKHRYIVCYSILATGTSPQLVAVGNLHQTLFDPISNDPILIGA